MRWALQVFGALLPVSISFATPLLDPATLNLFLGATIFMVVAALMVAEMLGRSLNLPAVAAWTKVELREVIASALLLVIVYAAMGSITFLPTLAGQNDPEGMARVFLTGQLTATQTGYTNLMRLMHYLTLRSGFGANYTLPTYWFYLTYGNSPYGGFSVLMGPLQMAAQGLVNAWFGYLGLSMLFEFGIRSAVILLPIGFIFRFIPFTRPLGTTLIALAIGAKVLLPLAILIAGQFHSLIDVPKMTIPERSISELDVSSDLDAAHSICSLDAVRILFGMSETLLGSLTCAAAGPFYAVCYNIVVYIVYPILDMVVRLIYMIIFAVNGGFGPYRGIGGGDAAQIVFDFLNQVNNFALVGYVDIVLVALVAYVGIKSVSAALGGDLLMGAVSRLIR